ncbi:MAG TPA: sigma-70 family RNA polymerase sigma factor, partial [Blastocatellia bacterium]
MAIKEKKSDSQERELITRAQRGDRAAFKMIYDLYRDRVYNLIFYSMGDELSSEDVLQIVFIKIYRGLPSFRFEARLATWIYRITLNECLNQQQRRGGQYVPFESLFGSDEEFDSAAPPDLQHADKERREIIHQAM